MLRFSLCLLCLSLTLLAAAQSAFTYKPTDNEVFIFKAESLLDRQGVVDFRVHTVIKVESYAFLGGGSLVVDDGDGDGGTTIAEFKIKSGPRPPDATPLLETHFYPATEADTATLPWKPKMIVAMTAN